MLTAQSPKTFLNMDDRTFSRRLKVLGSSHITSEALLYTYPGEGTLDSPYLVGFLPSDRCNPLEFSKSRKWTITLIHAGATFAVSFSSSVYTGGLLDIVNDLHTTHEIATLGISLFVLGFAFGPMLWAPLSELYGRQVVFFVSYLAITVFNGASAASPTISSLLVFRLLAGIFGACPLTNCGGVIADMFTARQRGMAGCIFSMAPFLGPAIGTSQYGKFSEL